MKTQNTSPLEGFTYEEHGRGFLMYSPKDHPLYGQKYLYDAWWMSSYGAWFFKREFEQSMIDMGARMVEDDESFLTEESSDQSGELSGYNFCEYDRGYMLYPVQDDPNYGKRYFYDGYWNSRMNGWFFEKAFFNDLVNMGAKFVRF